MSFTRRRCDRENAPNRLLDDVAGVGVRRDGPQTVTARASNVYPLPHSGAAGLSSRASRVRDDRREQLRALQLITEHARRATSQYELLNGVLQVLHEVCRSDVSTILTPAPSDAGLVVAASRGCPGGADAVTADGVSTDIGDGLRRGVSAEHWWRLATTSPCQRDGGDRRIARIVVELAPLGDDATRREVRCHLAAPLVIEGRWSGVVVVERQRAEAFDEWDEAVLEVAANWVALRLDAMTSAVGAPTRPGPDEFAGASQVGGPCASTEPLVFRFFESDDCVFVGDDYLVRNIPGRILWKLLREHVAGRTEFSNRELRLDPWLRLPKLRDNLESRLLLLRKRLQHRCPGLRIVPTRRGCFRLEATRPLRLQES